MFFASFTIKRPYTRAVKHPPRIELSYVVPERLDLVLDKGGRKIYTKVLGAADKAFYAMPSLDGFSGKYLQPLQTPYEPRMPDSGISDVARQACDDVSIRRVSRLDDAYCRFVEREAAAPFQRLLKDDTISSETRPPNETEAVRAPVVQIAGPLAARRISSRLVPFYGKAKRVLDMTTAGRRESQSDNLRIKCWVDAGGIVKFALVEKSSGAAKTDGMYLGAVKTWRFSPRPGPAAFDSGTITFIFE